MQLAAFFAPRIAAHSRSSIINTTPQHINATQARALHLVVNGARTLSVPSLAVAEAPEGASAQGTPMPVVLSHHRNHPSGDVAAVVSLHGYVALPPDAAVGVEVVFDKGGDGSGDGNSSSGSRRRRRQAVQAFLQLTKL